MHVLAESQADWIKSVASSRGFLRNAAPPQLVAPPVESHNATDDDDDDEPAKEDRLIEFGMAAMTLVNNLIESFRGGSRTNGKQTGGLDLKALLDWRRAAPQPDCAEPERTPLPTASSPADMMKALAALSPDFMIKLRAVREQLSPDGRRSSYRMTISPNNLPSHHHHRTRHYLPRRDREADEGSAVTAAAKKPGAIVMAEPDVLVIDGRHDKELLLSIAVGALRGGIAFLTGNLAPSTPPPLAPVPTDIDRDVMTADEVAAFLGVDRNTRLRLRRTRT